MTGCVLDESDAAFYAGYTRGMSMRPGLKDDADILRRLSALLSRHMEGPYGDEARAYLETLDDAASVPRENQSFGGSD